MPNSNAFRQLLAHPNRSLASLYSQVEQQKKLLKIVREALPDHLKERAVHCVIDRNKLMVYADSANWASQLRFYRTAILGAIDKIPSQQVDILQFKITEALHLQVEQPEERHVNVPCAASIAEIRHNAEAREDDSLACALLKLSLTLERLSKASSKNESSK
ncbi:DciA family protein [Methylotuvimicrobium alcaliphilum]|uniref:DUF721 domain-containing protein n=1 Tax=Methylotuvimicrobium alcaliphilum (strain DSM 19304 / NCIMB 14124 / VKM B-2133 / 20Z) TaxID=1091494 RepID=G4T1H9_META2|nr:DciA family protein [Methylotuvimicrobium alcaliphilum]CCE22401.1 conserved protein of unknown function [Methylotuvimicrobium alcaliphilum 20Z]